MSKAVTAPTTSVTTTDSAVAEVRTHQPLHQETQDVTTGTARHGASTLSDGAVAELKAAYVAVEHAIAEAKGDTAGSTTSEKLATDTATTNTEAAHTDSDKTADSTTHQPPAGPLVKILADATGETTATVQGVLQQVRAVLHQEHSTDASGDHGTTDTAASGTASTPAADAKPGDTQHWHDRLIAQHDGSGSASPTDAAGGQGAAEAGSALWQHFLNHYAAADSAVTTAPGVVAAVDGFVDTVQSLHLDNGPGQMHGHGTDGAHLDTAA
ncbi:hypothetical protein JHL17_14550 [Azospirillum sp. YIM B02556]|uniref:Uncharacterized protein n=1 Tax=Azospirillum endophyticum TaxID=2800326 RepID=A0ABS1F5F8_9PROT|nr:hypothetical protein [Azospirillum endophyticum]MBK1838636.1 hypothetical protein [Azospirillum endophyticum]